MLLFINLFIDDVLCIILVGGDTLKTAGYQFGSAHKSFVWKFWNFTVNERELSKEQMLSEWFPKGRN